MVRHICGFSVIDASAPDVATDGIVRCFFVLLFVSMVLVVMVVVVSPDWWLYGCVVNGMCERLVDLY